MFCTSCGANIPDDAQVCTACGAQILHAAQSGMPNAPEAAARSTMQPEEQPTKRIHMTPIVIALAVVAVAAAVVIFFLLGSR